MLVYLKTPMGYTQLGPYRIYGRKYAYGSFGSTDIPKGLYEENKNILEEAEYTGDWLSDRFDKYFPNIKFKLSELYRINNESLYEIAEGVGIKYLRKKKLSVAEKRALCRSISNMIS